MAFPIDSPLPIFYDRNGSVLDAGYVYIGQPNLNPITNPIPVFWSDGTPAPQPLRTVRGLIARNGAPSQVLVNSDFSIVVQDRNRQLVLNAPDSSTIDRIEAVIGQQSYASLSALRSAGVPGLDAGQTRVVTVLSHTSGTGVGGGQFRWDAASTAADDNALVVNPTGNPGAGRWVRMYEGPPMATYWGAVGDGVTNDTAALQAAMTWAYSPSRGLLIPDGTYSINASLTVPGSVGGWRIVGQSRTGTIIRQETNNVPCITFSGDLANNFEIGLFTLSHTSAQTDPTLPGCGIYYDLPGTTGNGIFNAYYHDIFFVNCGRGFMSNPAKSFPVWGSVFERIYTQRGCTGSLFYFRPNPAQGQPNNCFRDIYVFANNVLPTEFALINTNAQDTFEIHNCEVNEALLGSPIASITESSGTIGSIKLETGTYSQGGNVNLIDVANSNIEWGHLLLAVSDITNSTNVTGLIPNGGAGANIGLGNYTYGFTFSRLAPTSGTFNAVGANANDKIMIRRINDVRAAGYDAAVRLLDNTSTDSASGVSIANLLDPKFSANVGDANYTVAAYSPITIINYQGARTANRTVTLPSTSSNDLFNGLSYTLVVGTASAFTIDFGGVYTFPGSKTGAVTVTYRRFAWVLTSVYIS